MNKKQQYRLDSLHRAQQVLDRHADVLGAVNQTAARQQLDAVVAQLGATTVEQHARSRETLGETNRQRSLERSLRRGHMNPVAKFARAQLAGVPNFKALTPAAGKLKGPKLANTAKAMAEAAKPYADHFTAAQFPADFLEQLTAAADAVLSSIGTRSEKHVQRVGATTQVEQALKSGRSAMAALDAVVTRKFLGDARLTEEWRVAKRVVAKPGTVREITSEAPPASSPSGNVVAAVDVPAAKAA